MTKLLLISAVIIHILGFVSAFKALRESRTSQGAAAWIVFLLTFPYAALPAYWIFGRKKFHGYTKAKRVTDARIEKKFKTVLNELEEYRDHSDTSDCIRDIAEKLTDIPVMSHNNVDLLIDGEATFESILQGIDKARNYILFQFFIVHDDEIGRKVQGYLSKKAREGISVYFLYDEIGSYALPGNYLDSLRSAGVNVSSFNTMQGFRNRFQINFRNHRKIVVVDGISAWIGGHNVGDEYMGKSRRFGHWRDTHIRIEGPAVIAAQLSFAEDWYWASGKTMDGIEWIPKASEKSGVPVLIVPSGPADSLERATLMFLHAINSAKKRIWIASPYFVPDDTIITALQLAGLRGVDVRILIPDKADHIMVYLASFSYFREAGMTGVRFYRYTRGFLHQKTMLVDDSISAVGTVNFDNRSFRLNFEVTAIVADRIFAGEMEGMFLKDFADSKIMTSEMLNEKGFFFNVGSSLARLLSPVL